MRHDGRHRHCLAKLQQAPGHVVGGGDQANGGNALLSRPGRCFDCVGRSVDGVANTDALFQIAGRTLRDLQQATHVQSAIDTGYEHAGRTILGQQIEARSQPLRAAGQNDDGVGARFRIGGPVRDGGGEAK